MDLDYFSNLDQIRLLKHWTVSIEKTLEKWQAHTTGLEQRTMTNYTSLEGGRGVKDDM